MIVLQTTPAIFTQSAALRLIARPAPEIAPPSRGRSPLSPRNPRRPNPQETYSYHASKAGLIHLTRRLTGTLIRENVVMTVICPGAFASDMNTAARDRAEDVSTPFARIAEPNDMAGPTVFLGSRAGDDLVGTALTVDDGLAASSMPV